MKNVAVLDCTLRDGAYLVDKYFGKKNIHGIINGLVNSRIDYIELGFLQDEGFGEGKTVFKNTSEANDYIPLEKFNSKFCLFADFSRYSIDNLDFKNNSKIDVIRECFFKHERFDALKVCKEIKRKGYELFVQPVDILSYNDSELIELIEKVNEIEADTFSIVDTFGSMYIEDLEHIFSILNNNLDKTVKIGFHSHNNLQMSNSLSQTFIRMSISSNIISVIDSTLNGMGKGAGNTPTELISQYLINKHNAHYDIDVILDTIDTYIDVLKTKANWGYNLLYFLTGSYSSHVNNLLYLKNKNSLSSKDMKYVLNSLGEKKKRYDYDLLESKYLEYLKSDIDDKETLTKLKEEFREKKILILAPGNTIKSEFFQIEDFISLNNPIIISVNFVFKKIKSDYIYINNVSRYAYLKDTREFISTKKLITSNIKHNKNNGEMLINVNRLINFGNGTSDNSTIMLLKLLRLIDVKKIYIAGFDGFSEDLSNQQNYFENDFEINKVRENPSKVNKEISITLKEFLDSKLSKDISIQFLTSSKFKNLLR